MMVLMFIILSNNLMNSYHYNIVAHNPITPAVSNVEVIQNYSTLDFHGLAYGAYRSFGPPNEFILRKNVAEDLEILKRLNVTHIRTYGLNLGQNVIPEEAKKVGIECATGIWLEPNNTINQHYLNENEISTGIELANISSHLIVGNEVILTEKLSINQLISYINKVKNQTNTPVATAEPWGVFYENPSLVNACDVLFVHVYAYWEGQGPYPTWDNRAAEYTVDRIEFLQAKYPDKEIYLAEAGWPSGNFEFVDPYRWSENAQKAFYSDLLPLIAVKGIKSYLFSAFDEAWKVEGGVGPYWGVFREDRTPKPSAEVLEMYFGGEVDWPAPISTSPNDFSVHQDSQANISWIITDIDNNTGSFEVFKDNIKLDLIENTWTNGTPVVVNVDTSIIGSFNYTIMFSDGISEGQDSVIVNITPILTSSTDSTTLPTTLSTPGFYLLYFVIFFTFAVLIRVRKKKT